MMKTNLLLLIIALGFIACNKNKLNTEVYQSLEAFDSIKINSSFDVYLKEGNTFSIRILGHKRQLENIHFEVVDHVLSIQNDTKGKWLTPQQNKVELYITSLPLSKVSLSETCKLETLNPITSDYFGLALTSKANEATLDLNCNEYASWSDVPTAGKLTLRGSANKATIKYRELMSVDAQHLTTQDAYIESNGKGDCSITVNNELTYSINGEGNILLYGSDTTQIINTDGNGSGQLIIH